MDIIEWNKTLFNHFFNKKNENRNVYINPDRSLIEKLGPKDSDAFEDFLLSIENGYNHSKHLVKDLESVLYNNQAEPKYFIYLCLFVLAESATDESFSYKEYYPKLRSLIPNDSNYKNFTTGNMVKCCGAWFLLEQWCEENSFYKGRFEINPIGTNFYVGLPRSQYLISEKNKDKLHLFFKDNNLSPYNKYSDNFILRLLKENNFSFLNKRILRHIKTNHDFITNFILPSIKFRLTEWNGEYKEKNKLCYSGNILLTFKINRIENTLKFDYRIDTREFYGQLDEFTLIDDSKKEYQVSYNNNPKFSTPIPELFNLRGIKKLKLNFDKHQFTFQKPKNNIIFNKEGSIWYNSSFVEVNSEIILATKDPDVINIINDKSWANKFESRLDYQFYRIKLIDENFIQELKSIIGIENDILGLDNQNIFKLQGGIISGDGRVSNLYYDILPPKIIISGKDYNINKIESSTLEFLKIDDSTLEIINPIGDKHKISLEVENDDIKNPEKSIDFIKLRGIEIAQEKNGYDKTSSFTKIGDFIDGGSLPYPNDNIIDGKGLKLDDPWDGDLKPRLESPKFKIGDIIQLTTDMFYNDPERTVIQVDNTEKWLVLNKDPKKVGFDFADNSKTHESEQVSSSDDEKIEYLNKKINSFNNAINNPINNILNIISHEGRINFKKFDNILIELLSKEKFVDLIKFEIKINKLRNELLRILSMEGHIDIDWNKRIIHINPTMVFLYQTATNGQKKFNLIGKRDEELILKLLELAKRGEFIHKVYFKINTANIESQAINNFFDLAEYLAPVKIEIHSYSLSTLNDFFKQIELDFKKMFWKKHSHRALEFTTSYDKIDNKLVNGILLKDFIENNLFSVKIFNYRTCSYTDKQSEINSLVKGNIFLCEIKDLKKNSTIIYLCKDKKYYQIESRDYARFILLNEVIDQIKPIIFWANKGKLYFPTGLRLPLLIERSLRLSSNEETKIINSKDLDYPFTDIKHLRVYTNISQEKFIIIKEKLGDLFHVLRHS